MKINRIAKLAVFVTLVVFTQNLISYAHDDEDLEFFHPVEITKGKNLSMIDCISLAYQNSPKIKRRKYNLDIAKSNVGIARAGYFPVINAGVGIYNEYNSNHVYYDRHYRDLPAVGVSINKMVWDFGKTTANIKMEEFYKIGAEYEFMDSLCSTLFDVKWKYYNVLRTKAVRDINLENLKMQNDILKLMENKHPDYDNAQGVLSANKIEYIGSEDAYKNAMVDLDNAMYLGKHPQYDIVQTDTFSYYVPKDLKDWEREHKPHTKHVFPFTREEAPKIAYKNSPDLHVLIATKKAMVQALNYVKRSYLPELDANVGYGYNHTLPASNNSLQVGVSLNSSVNLMELRHSIKGADAQLALAQNEIDLFKQDLYYEIQRAFNNLDRVEEQLPHARRNVFLSMGTYNVAVDKYKQGLTDFTAVQDAKLDYINSNIVYVNKLYEYNTALIQVEMALHCHLIDIHNKSGHAVHHHSDELINNLVEALECTKGDPKKTKKRLFSIFSKDEDDSLDEEENL